jgi:phosphoglycerate dehydrogenase-like enzyme
LETEAPLANRLKEELLAKGKVVFITHEEPGLRDVFIAEAPCNLEVVLSLANPNASEQEVNAAFGSELLQDADFLVLYCRWRVPDQVIRRARRLKLIQTMGQGTDHIPVQLASELGIPVANSGGANAVAVAEHSVLLMLATLRNLLPSVEALRQGKFAKDMDRRYFHQLHGKTVGIVGFGCVGKRVAKLLNGFGANVIFFDNADIPQSIFTELRARRVSLEELLSSSDIVSLHIPLLESTRGLIGGRELRMMKPSAVLINTSRGRVIDEAALIQVLRDKNIAGAGLDVYEQEPPSPGNPLLKADNVVATPHIGGEAWETWPARIIRCWENLLRVWEGKEPYNVVSPSKGHRPWQ